MKMCAQQRNIYMMMYRCLDSSLSTGTSTSVNLEKKNEANLDTGSARHANVIIVRNGYVDSSSNP